MVFFGLGNPGPRYELTRHNAGFLTLDELAAKHGVEWVRETRDMFTAKLVLASTRVILVKPQTYVNVAGVAAATVCQRFQIEPAEMLVIVDDIALPFGQLRLRRRGSDGGHNGLKSIISRLGTTDFPRLRLGVGSAPAGVDPADYVLSRFPRDESETAREMIERAVECLEAVVIKGFERAMNSFNSPSVDPG